MLGASDGRLSGDDSEESCLCRRIRLWLDQDAKIVREGMSSAKAPRPMEEWRFVVKDRYPAYIDWPTYEKIRGIIRDNRAEYMRTKTRGVPRDGSVARHRPVRPVRLQDVRLL
jgi:hypothetical protein